MRTFDVVREIVPHISHAVSPFAVADPEVTREWGMASTPSLRRVVVGASMLVPILVLGACSDGGDTVPVEDDPSTTTAAGADTASDYCRAAGQFSGEQGLDLSGDPDAALAGIEAMAATAPDEIAGDLQVVVEGVRSLGGLDENDPDALAGIFELLADPEVGAAIERVEEFTAAECGIDLGSDGSADGLDSTPDDGTIDLEDVDAVTDGNAASSWADKLSATVINFGSEVQVSSAAGALSADEALEACEALLSSLSGIDPEVTVEVAAGETVLARSSDGSCIAA